MTIVYVAERGCYEDRCVAGIYASPEEAMASQPKARWTATIWDGYKGEPPSVSWENDLDGGDACTIRPMYVEHLVTRRSPDVCQKQVLNRKSGDWDYMPVTEADIREVVHMAKPRHLHKKGR